MNKEKLDTQLEVQELLKKAMESFDPETLNLLRSVPESGLKNKSPLTAIPSYLGTSFNELDLLHAH